MPARGSHLIKVFLLFLIASAIFLFLPRKLFAAVISPPLNVLPEVQIGITFNVHGNLDGVQFGQAYFVKCRLGASTSDLGEGQTYHPSSGNWLFDNGAWVNMPVIEISGEPIDFSLQCRVKSGVSSGSKIIYLGACLKEEDGSCKKSFPSSSGVNFTALVESSPTSTPTPTPTPSPTPIPTVASSPSTATYKINEVKNKDGDVLSNVEVYVDGEYVHHYTPELLEFCDGCYCDNDQQVNCGFGEHTIRLEKSGYQDWNETKTMNSGNTYEVNPVMEVEDSTSPTATSTPTSTSIVTSTPTSKPTGITETPTPGEVLGEKELYPLETTGEAEENQESSSSEKSGRKVLPFIFLGLGFAFLFGAGFYFWYTQLR